MKYTPKGKKNRLIKAKKQNRRIPFWVMMRTKRQVTNNPKRRFWRSRKLQR